MSTDYVHRTELVEGQSWSSPGEGNFRHICSHCNWRGQWRVDPFAARRDGAAHVMAAFNGDES